MHAITRKYTAKTVIAGAGIALLGGFLVLFYSSDGVSARVQKRTLTRDIVTQGTIVAAKKIELAFAMEGSIKEIKVKPGDAVKFNDVLAVLDTRALEAQKRQLEAVLALDKAKLMQLLAGVPKEEITLAESKVEAARNALDAARRAFQDSRLKADNDLASSYAKAVEYTNTVLLNADNAMKALESIYDERNQFRDFFMVPDSKKKGDVQWQMIFARTAFENVKTKYEGLKTNASNENVDLALSDFKTNLEVIRSLLSNTAELLNNAIVSVGDIEMYRKIIVIQRTVLNETQSAILDFEQKITSQKITDQAMLGTAKSNVTQTEAALKTSEGELAMKKSSSQAVALAVAQAQIKEDESLLEVAKGKIANATLSAPADGVIEGVYAGSGSAVRAHAPTLVFIPLADLQIEAELSINQAAMVKVGDSAIISSESLQAPGVIASIHGTSVTVYFQNKAGAWRLESDAEVRIKATIKKDALMIPQDFIKEDNGVKKVIILENGEKKERIVLTGVTFGNESEATEGVSEGELLVR